MASFFSLAAGQSMHDLEVEECNLVAVSYRILFWASACFQLGLRLPKVVPLALVVLVVNDDTID